ncbi:energy transducer TonB [Snodgrassella alvi]|nr:energy transducer TonB [Snodgrassella alvi]
MLVLVYIANNNCFYYHNANMENQRKVNFLIVVFVLGMHAFLFWALITAHVEQEIDINPPALTFVDLNMISNQVGNDDDTQKPRSQQSNVHKNSVTVPARKVIPAKSLIEPVVTTKAHSQFKVTPTKEDVPNLSSTAEKTTSTTHTSANNSSSGSVSVNDSGGSETTSANGKSNRGQTGGSVVVPKEYQGGFLTELKLPYPKDSLENEEEGSVGVIVSVSANGTAQKVVISKSSGYRRLDRAAKRAVLKHRFKPATRDGVPIPYSYNFNIGFNIIN